MNHCAMNRIINTMDTQSLPCRASDAGPDDAQNTTMSRQSLYSLLVEEAMEDAHELSRCYRDARREEQRARLDIIVRLKNTLQKLQEVV